jgi:hypothetical protein
MADKLGIGAVFPDMSIDLVSGGSLALPRGISAKYPVILFYRGHW